MWPGQALSLKVENVLFHEKSKYQDVLLFTRYMVFAIKTRLYLHRVVFSNFARGSILKFGGFQ